MKKLILLTLIILGPALKIAAKDTYGLKIIIESIDQNSPSKKVMIYPLGTKYHLIAKQAAEKPEINTSYSQYSGSYKLKIYTHSGQTHTPEVIDIEDKRIRIYYYAKTTLLPSESEAKGSSDNAPLARAEILDEREKAVNVYPIPAKDFMTISFQTPVAERTTIKIFDLSGKLVYTTNIDEGSRTADMSVIGLLTGIYALTISADNQILHQQKIIVK